MTPEEFAMLRRIWDLSQRELAEILGVAKPTIANYELGRRNIPGSVAMQMAWLRRGYRPDEWPVLMNGSGRGTRPRGPLYQDPRGDRFDFLNTHHNPDAPKHPSTEEHHAKNPQADPDRVPGDRAA